MKLKFEFSSIKQRFIFWFLIIGITPVIVSLTLVYFQRVENIKNISFEKLESIRDLKVNRIQSFLKERSIDIEIMASAPFVQEIQFTENQQRSIDLKLQKINKLRNGLTKFLNRTSDYSELFLVNPKTGIIEVSTNTTFEGQNRIDNAYVINTLKTRKPFIKNIYYSENTKNYEMTVSVPIFKDGDASNEIIGVFVARINLKENLYATLLAKTGLGETGETFIVDKEGLALSELRWKENAPLNFKLKAVPALKAAAGETGTDEGVDYRNTAVLVSYTYLPNMEWGFVVKQDQDEIYKPVQKLFYNLLWMVLGSVLVILIFSYFISKILSQQIELITKVAKKISQGDFSARAIVQGTDEVAQLADSFNKSSDVIAEKMTQEQYFSEISKAIVGNKSIKEYSDELLKTLMQISKADIGVFYQLNTDKNTYVPINSIGAQSNLLANYKAATAEGEIGLVLKTKKIRILSDIPKNTQYIHRTSVGDMIPSEIVSIPILIDNEVAAIISLASIHQIDHLVVDVLTSAAISLNTSYANLDAAVKTAQLAVELESSNKSLEQQTIELQSQAEELQIQSTEMQNISEELQQQNYTLEQKSREIEEANRLKSEFLSNMSHELRTPLNSILALSNVLRLQTSDRLDEEELNYLEIVERNGKNLLHLINDILDLSKIEAGKLDLFPTVLNTSLVIEEVIESMEPLAAKKGLALNLSIAPNIPAIETDENRWRQVMTNVLNNAVKFTEKGGVTVDVTANNENLFIKIKDTGVGISEEHRHSIFEKFRQIDGTSSRHYEGTGLGLAIVLELLNKLNGDIKLDSTLGEGTTFTLILPLIWEDKRTTKAIKFDSDLKPIHANKPLVLVVDDEPSTARLISNYLKESDYDTIIAHNGVDALRLAETHHLYAITLDILMPDLDGYEVLQRLKQNPKMATIPVIMVSVSTEKETGFALGAVGHINKPVLKKSLINEINRLHSNPKKVMVVDDNEFELNYLASYLAEEEMEVQKVSSGKECLLLLEQELPDVLVLDLVMPEINGFQVLDQIRSNPLMKHLPVVVATAKDLTERERTQLSQNIASLVVKSTISNEAVLKEIKVILANLHQPQTAVFNVENQKATSVKRVLIVEDNIEAIVQIKYVLENEGYQVEVASSGHEALAAMVNLKPDGIILDLMMPGMDGFEVLEMMQKNPLIAKIPVIILSAKTLDKDDLKRLENKNVHQLVQKGAIDVKGLLSKVNTIVHLNTPLKELIADTSKDLSPTVQLIAKKDTIKVVIMEDNPDNMVTLKALLKEGYDIIEAFDGEEGMKAVRKHQPDLILLDIQMPIKDGFEVIRELKSDHSTSQIPVIAITARAMTKEKDEILKAGCNGFVSKPVNKEALTNEINRFIEN